MKRIVFWTLILAVSFLWVELFPEKAEAIPAFARKYKTTCITCHATFPRLTALGEAFRLNGYKMPDGDELYIKDQPLSMGVSAYKKVFPDAVWPSDMPGLPPIAIRVTEDVVYDIGADDPRITFNTPEIKILSAGSFGDSMSFFAEIGFGEAELELEVEHVEGEGHEEEEGHEAGEEHAVTIEEHTSGIDVAAWLMWEDIFFGDNHLNFRIGSIGMQDLALPNTRNHNRITREGYLYADALRLHAHGSNNMGVELNGFDRSWRYNVGILQGDGETSKKDFYGALAIKIGGLGFDGSGGTTDEGGLDATPAGYWRDDSILFGVFGYRSYVGHDDEKADRYGADVRVNYKDLSAAAGYIKGDGIPAGHGGHAAALDKDIFFAEAEYFVYPWLQPYVRYEDLSVDAHEADSARFIIGTVLLARANVKFNVEGRFYSKNEPVVAAGGDKSDNNLIALRLDYAF